MMDMKNVNKKASLKDLNEMGLLDYLVHTPVIKCILTFTIN